MSKVTCFPRYSTHENVVTNTTLHLFQQINQHSVDKLKSVLSELLGDVDVPLGIDFNQQQPSGSSVPDGHIYQERLNIAIETKVGSGVNIDQLLRHLAGFTKGQPGNHLLLLTKDEIPASLLDPVVEASKTAGAVFRAVTFDRLCEAIKLIRKEYEVHLWHVVDDYISYCSDTGLLPDKRKWMRIVPCGASFALNERHHVYYQPSERGYSRHEYIGIYKGKAVRLVARVAAVYENHTNPDGSMRIECVGGEDKPVFHGRITQMVAESETMLGWDVSNGYRFFCGEEFVPTEFSKTSSGGIQGARFWDISNDVEAAPLDQDLAQRLRRVQWA